MKKNLLIAIVCCAFASSSMGAVTISLSGNPTTAAQLFTSVGAAGTIVQDDMLVRIGTFNTTPAAGATFTELASSFHEFARTTTGRDPAAGQPPPGTPVNSGRINRLNISGSDAATSPDADSFFIGKNIYIWVYNSAAGGDTIAQGIFLSTAATATFADQATPVSVSGGTWTQAFGTNAGWTPASVELNAGGTAAVRLNLSAPPIPEPAVTMFGGLVAILGLARRRR